MISNLLDDVMALATKEGVPLLAVQRAEEAQRSTASGVERAASPAKARQALDGRGAVLVAGTSWLWASKEMRGSVDTLVVDEAGQMSLANVVAMAPAARNIVLLGDPQQLEQPLQGAHPPGAGCVGARARARRCSTIPPHRGLFLEHTWRLHPEICAFTSELFYEDRLNRSLGSRGNRSSVTGRLPGSGLRWLSVAHEGNRNESPEEVEGVAGCSNA